MAALASGFSEMHTPGALTSGDLAMCKPVQVRSASMVHEFRGSIEILLSKPNWQTHGSLNALEKIQQRHGMFVSQRSTTALHIAPNDTRASLPQCALSV